MNLNCNCLRGRSQTCHPYFTLRRSTAACKHGAKALSGVQAAPLAQQQVAHAAALLSVVATAIAASPTMAWAAPAAAAAARPPLAEALLNAAAAPYPAIQWEAVAALRALCEHHFPALQPHWPAVSASVQQRARDAAASKPTVTDNTARRRSADAPYAASLSDKAANQALRLAGDFVRQAFLHSVAAAAARNGEGPAPMDAAAVRDLAAGFCTDMCCLAQESPSPAIRAAAFATLATVPPALWDALAPDAVAAALDAACSRARADAHASVRSNAFKALEASLRVRALMLLPRQAAATISVALRGVQDSAVSVRQAAAAAVAAIARALQCTVDGKPYAGFDDEEGGAETGFPEDLESYCEDALSDLLPIKVWASLGCAVLRVASRSAGDKVRAAAHGPVHRRNPPCPCV